MMAPCHWTAASTPVCECPSFLSNSFLAMMHTYMSQALESPLLPSLHSAAPYFHRPVLFSSSLSRILSADFDARVSSNA